MVASRTRNWVCVVYPESSPNNWTEILAGECVPAIVSPLHDKDVNPTGEPKKPHWHVILQFAGVKSRDQVIDICNKFGGVNPGPCNNLQGYARYLIHKDNPEKAQYDPQDIQCFSGADWSDLIKTSKDRYDALGAIMQFAHDHNISYYSDLMDYCKNYNREWFEICCDNTIVLKSYCISQHTKNKDTNSDVLAHDFRNRPNTLPDRPVEYNSF